MNVLELSEQEIIRRNSLNELRAMGIEPYPAAEYVTNAFSTDIKAEFNDDAEPRQVSIAGRIMSRRVMGKASFMELQDSKGRVQVYVTRDDICPGDDKEMYNTVFKRLLDLGDIVGIEGFVFRTGRTGWQGENRHLIEYHLKLDSNPEFSSSVLTACARAAFRPNAEGGSGCKTLFDIPPAYLSPLDGAALRATML